MIAPEFMREQEEKLGSMIAPTFEKMLPGGEFRPGGLAAAKKAANAAGIGEENAGFAVKEVSTQGVADALQAGLDKLTKVIEQKTLEAINKVERDMFRANNGKTD